jgi:opacity protein-like surface antigen
MFFMSVAVVANAQLNLKWGVKAGLNLSSISNFATDDEDDKMKAGFHVGAFGQYMFTEQLGVEAGLYYSLLGAKSEFSESDDDYSSESKTTANASYLQLPITAFYKFNINKNLSIYPSVGLYLGYGIGGKVKTEYSDVALDDIDDSESGSYKDDFFIDEDGIKHNKFDFGLTFGLNLQYGHFIGGVGYDLGLTKINDYTLDKDLKNRNFKISVGYVF